jgi:hypothetical protein
MNTTHNHLDIKNDCSYTSALLISDHGMTMENFPLH